MTGAVDIRFEASDNKGIKEVQLFVDEVLKISLSEQRSSTFTFKLDTDEYDNGNYQIFAKAIDKSDNETSSETLNVEFFNERTYEIVNNTVVDIMCSVSFEWDGEIIAGEKLAKSRNSRFFSIPKNKDFRAEVYNTGHCEVKYVLLGDTLLNANEDEVWEFNIPDTYFALFTENGSGIGVDYIESNGQTCHNNLSTPSIPSQDNYIFISFFNNQPGSNYIRWNFGSSGSFPDYYLADGSGNDVPVVPYDSNQPTLNLYVSVSLPYLLKPEPPSTMDNKDNLKIKTMYPFNADGQTESYKIIGALKRIK